MKVGFLGNVNNHPFAVAKHFKDKGADVRFFVEAPQTDILYRPESTGYVTYPYPDWITEYPALRKSVVIHFPQLFARDVIRELNSCDAVIVNDYGHRFLPYLDKKVIRICMFTGGDLEIMADLDNVTEMRMTSPKLKHFPAWFKKAYAKYSVRQLESGIRQADLVGYYPKGLNPFGDKLLQHIFQGKPFRQFSHWCVMLDGLAYELPPAHEKLRIFNVARFIWKKPFPPGTTKLEDKANDIMIYGLAKFLRRHPGSLDIHFVEKGIHLAETKALIDELGIRESITWHREMPLKNLFEHIRQSDIVFDQMGSHLFGAGIFAMAMGRPLITNARPDILAQVTDHAPSPVCHAVTPEQVDDWLEKLYNDRELRERIGKDSSNFAFRYMDIRHESDFYYNFIIEKMKLLHLEPHT